MVAKVGVDMIAGVGSQETRVVEGRIGQAVGMDGSRVVLLEELYHIVSVSHGMRRKYTYVGNSPPDLDRSLGEVGLTLFSTKAQCGWKIPR